MKLGHVLEAELFMSGVDSVIDRYYSFGSKEVHMEYMTKRLAVE
jgi:hypothetical protein